MLEFRVAMQYKQVRVLLDWLCEVQHFVKMQVVLNIAVGAAAEFRPASLAVVYDELLRKEVENKAGQLGASWDFAKSFTQVDDNVWRMARRSACVVSACLISCDCTVSQESSS